VKTSSKYSDIFIAVFQISTLVVVFSIKGYSNCQGNCENGYGKYTYPNGDSYVGQWEHGKRNGEGTMEYTDGSCRSGKWVDNVFIEGEETLVVSKKEFKDVNIEHQAHNFEWWNVILGIIASVLAIFVSFIEINKFRKKRTE
jgi:hypothetical protein